MNKRLEEVSAQLQALTDEVAALVAQHSGEEDGAAIRLVDHHADRNAFRDALVGLYNFVIKSPGLKQWASHVDIVVLSKAVNEVTGERLRRRQ